MPPSHDEIRAQLARLVSSAGFASADRMSAFLTYVVERALAGEAAQVKEYAVGVDVFGREPGYDPRLDSIVRVEARRLRTKLSEYYSAQGARAPIVIQLPLGGYVPTFEQAALPADVTARAAESAGRAPHAAAAAVVAPARRHTRPMLTAGVILLGALVMAGAAWRTATHSARRSVSIAVMPFAHYSGNDEERRLAERLTDGVTRELARPGRLAVVSHTSAVASGHPRQRAPEIGRTLGAELLVEGSVVRTGDRVEVSVRLVRAAADRKMWVQDFAGSLSELGHLERGIAAAIEGATLEPAPR